MTRFHKQLNSALLFLSIITFLGLHPQLSLAQGSADATPAPPGSEAVAPNPEATESLKERIEKVVQEKSASIEETVAAASQRKRALVGTIERLSNESLSLLGRGGSTIIPLTDELTFYSNGSPVELDRFVVGDHLLVLGVLVDDTFTPRILEAQESPFLDEEFTAVLGTITEIDDNELSFSPRQTTELLTLTLTRRSELLDLSEAEIDEDDLQANLQAIVVYAEDQLDADGADTDVEREKRIVSLKLLSQAAAPVNDQ